MKLPKKWTKYSDFVAYTVAYRIDLDRRSGNPGRKEFIENLHITSGKDSLSQMI